MLKENNNFIKCLTTQTKWSLFLKVDCFTPVSLSKSKKIYIYVRNFDGKSPSNTFLIFFVTHDRFLSLFLCSCLKNTILQ